MSWPKLNPEFSTFWYFMIMSPNSGNRFWLLWHYVSNLVFWLLVLKKSTALVFCFRDGKRVFLNTLTVIYRLQWRPIKYPGLLPRVHRTYIFKRRFLFLHLWMRCRALVDEKLYFPLNLLIKVTIISQSSMKWQIHIHDASKSMSAAKR